MRKIRELYNLEKVGIVKAGRRTEIFKVSMYDGFGQRCQKLKKNRL